MMKEESEQTVGFESQSHPQVFEVSQPKMVQIYICIMYIFIYGVKCEKNQEEKPFLRSYLKCRRRPTERHILLSLFVG